MEEKYLELKATSFYALYDAYGFHLTDLILIFTVSESESTKGSVDCLPKLSYQTSSSIVRLSSTNNNSADKIPGEGTGELNSILLLCAGYLVSVFLVNIYFLSLHSPGLFCIYL